MSGVGAAEWGGSVSSVGAAEVCRAYGMVYTSTQLFYLFADAVIVQ